MELRVTIYRTALTTGIYSVPQPRSSLLCSRSSDSQLRVTIYGTQFSVVNTVRSRTTTTTTVNL